MVVTDQNGNITSMKLMGGTSGEHLLVVLGVGTSGAA
jgi:hypothetical protein